MELIAEKGSIAAAGKAMGMSYKRAWSLVASLNAMFDEPAVTVQHGGAHGGGAGLTDFGRTITARFRNIERTAENEAKADIDALVSRLKTQALSSASQAAAK